MNKDDHTAAFDSHARIDESLRKRFEQAWASGQPESVESCLPDASSAEYLPTLEELVQIEMEFAWKQWRARSDHHLPAGQTVRPPSVADYLKRFEQLNDSAIIARLAEQESQLRCQMGDTPDRAGLAEQFPTVPPSLTGMLAEAATNSDELEIDTQETLLQQQPSADTGKSQKPTASFGGYQLLEEIGRGGMGVVYRARQLKADRLVALKVIRRDHLESASPEVRRNAIDRFRQECLAAARIEHEHIVRVYEVGSHDGNHFFSMQLVNGCSLSELSRGQPLENRRAARYVMQVARAVHQAHERGILHRDLKPQNVLIDAADDRALVADFGLAKLSLGDSELTHTGDLMGTPPFMSPELAQDPANVGAASDIYALGATLYNLLCGRPPFQAAIPVETMRQVIHDEPVAPARLNPAIDRDLETICLKCLRKEPQQRYATADALADDLERYLQDRPILARPATLPERLVRWRRRNRLAATALALAAGFLVTALVATTAGYLITSEALSEKTSALESESAALEASQKGYQASRDAINQFFTVVSEDALRDQPGMQPVREELLRVALKQYERFIAEHGNNTSAAQEYARTHFRVGLISEMLEESVEGPLESFNRARTIQEQLLQESRSDDLQQEYGETLNEIARLQTEQANYEEALQTYEVARDVRQRLSEADPADIERSRRLANTIMNVGLVHKRQGETAAAITAFDKAQAIRQQAVAGANNSGDGELLLVRRDLAMGYYNRANLLSLNRDTSDALEDVRDAIRLFEALTESDTQRQPILRRLAICYLLEAQLHVRSTELTDASNSYRRAIEVLQELANLNPQVIAYREQLSAGLIDLGTLELQRERLASAVETFERAVALLAEIVPNSDSAEFASRRSNYAIALLKLGRTQLELGDHSSAASNLKLARRYQLGLIEQSPKNTLYQSVLRKIDSATEQLQAELVQD